MNKNIAQDYLNEYKKEIERLYGKERADKSIFDYYNGWFKTGIATKYQDGSIGNAEFFIIRCRLKEFEVMISKLKNKK